MERNYFFIFLVTLIFSLVSCNKNNDNHQAKLGIDSVSSKLNQTERVGASLAQPKDLIDETNARSNIVQESKDFILGSFMDGSLGLYFFIGISLLSLIVMICFFVILMKIQNRLNSQRFKDYIIDSIIVDSYNRKGRIFKLINDHTKKRENQTMLSERSIEPIVEKIVERYFTVERNVNIIVDRALECIHLDKKEQSANEIQQDEILNPSISENLYLYASSADINNNSFYKVTPHSDDDSIYKLLVNGDNAQFFVYEGAFGKVIEVPDFLECACDVQRLGSQFVITKEFGVAEKDANGSWIIKSKAKVIIN